MINNEDHGFAKKSLIPEDINVQGTWAKIRERYPDLDRNRAILILEVLVDRDFTAEEKAALP